MQEVLAIYRVGNISLSSNKLKAIKRTWNLYKQEELPIYKRIYCFMCYAYNAVKRRIKKNYLNCKIIVIKYIYRIR